MAIQGFVKIGDFGFAKVLESNNRTYTFCGTPGYVAPENGEHQQALSAAWAGSGKCQAHLFQPCDRVPVGGCDRVPVGLFER